METGACARYFASQVLALQDQYSVFACVFAFFLSAARARNKSRNSVARTVPCCTGCRALKERGSVMWGANLVPSLRPASPYMYSRD